jgi:hypothetical protein
MTVPAKLATGVLERSITRVVRDTYRRNMKLTHWPAAILLAAGLVLTTVPAASAVATWNLISGQQITSGSARCTLGFNARTGSTRYVVTAGSCTSVPGTWSGAGGVIGPSAGSSFPGNDYGLIQVTSAAAVSTPLVDRYSSGADVTITGSTTPPAGTGVCYSSPVSGWHCGTVTALNQTVCFAEGCVSGLVRTTMCPEAGSTGAPVVTNPSAGSTVRAVGVVAGGSGNCTSGGTTYVQPIGEVLSAYGLALVTG